MSGTKTSSRRSFLKSTALMSGLPFIPTGINDSFAAEIPTPLYQEEAGKSIIGNYGEWASGLAQDPPRLSFRNEQFNKVEDFKSAALEKARELVAAPEVAQDIQVSVDKKYSYDGLEVEELSWQLPYGNRTKAILLRPEGSNVKLPGVLGLHDHGGNKYFGRRKILQN